MILFSWALCHSEKAYSEIIAYKTYKVAQKDTVYSIAKKLKIQESEIISINGKKVLENLKIGEILKYPDKKKETVRFQIPLTKKTKIEKRFSNIPQFPFKGILFSPGKDPSVFSIGEGKVMACDYMDGYENYVIISHSKGYYSLYGNLNEIYVTEGQKVSENEKIGKLIKARGLYFQINNHGKPVDPENFLN